MEFKTLRNIENSFRQIRLYAIVFAVLCIGVVGYAVWQSYRFAEEQRQKIYVLDNGKSLMLALSQDASINRPVEAREHVRRFHELFFTLAPDIVLLYKMDLNYSLHSCQKRFFHCFKFRSYNIHILTDFLTGNLCINLCGGNIFMPHHLT
jgi:conjugative transposon TraK protein